jgi:very-short-patch-repair endonuclease
MGPVRRQISPHAARLRRDMTDAEKLLWSRIRARQLGNYKFRRQVSIGPFVVDFLCAEARLIVELDGGQHNSEVDAHRTAVLKNAGYRIVRFWNNDVLENPEGVLATLLVILGEDPHPPKADALGPSLSRKR